MSRQTKANLFALTAVLFWSTVAVAFKIALRYLNFAQLLFFASWISLFSFYLIALIQKKGSILLKTDKKEWLRSARNGFLNPFLYYLVLLKAYSILPAQLAQPLNYLWPVMLVLLSVPLLGEKLSAAGLISVIVGFLGVYLIASRGEPFDIHIENPTGVIMAAGSSLIWALSWIYSKKSKCEEISKLFRNFLFGAIYISIYLWITGDFFLPGAEGLLAAVYVGLFETGITFFLWMKALQMSERSDSISKLVFISPFLALVFIYLILDEDIFYTTIIGLIFIISGALLKTGKKK